jgi:hypothetical protein
MPRQRRTKIGFFAPLLHGHLQACRVGEMLLNGETGHGTGGIEVELTELNMATLCKGTSTVGKPGIVRLNAKIFQVCRNDDFGASSKLFLFIGRL